MNHPASDREHDTVRRTALERQLVECAVKGRELVCSKLSSDLLALPTMPRPEISAHLIRELLLGCHGVLDPRGVRVRGAWIAGELDLAHVTSTANLELVDCLFTGAIIVTSADLPRLNLSGSRVGPLRADGAWIRGDLIVVGTTVVGTSEHCALDLHGAHLGRLRGEGASISNPFGNAFRAGGLLVDGDVLIKSARFAAKHEEYAVTFSDAHIGGQLDADNVSCVNLVGVAFQADHARVASSLSFEAAEFIGHSTRGTLRLASAHVGTQLNGNGIRCRNTAAGPALHADSLHVDGSAYLEDALFTNNGDRAAVRMPSGYIDGQLAFRGTRVFNGAAPGVELQGTSVTGMIFFPATLVCQQPWGRSCPCSRMIGLEDFTFGSLAEPGWEQWLHLIRFHTVHYSPSPYQKLAAAERAAGHDANARHILIAQQDDLHRLARESFGGRLNRVFHRAWGVLAGYGYRARRTAVALSIVLATTVLLGFWAGQVETHPGYAAERTVTSGTPGMRCSPIELAGLGLDRGLPFAFTGLRARCDLDTGTTAGQVFTAVIWFTQVAVWGLATLALAGFTGLVRKPG